MKIARTLSVGAAIAVGAFVVPAGAAGIRKPGTSGHDNSTLGMILDYFAIDGAAGGEEGISPHPPKQEAHEFEKAWSVRNVAEGEDGVSSRLAEPKGMMLETSDAAPPSLNLGIDDATRHIGNNPVSYGWGQDTGRNPVVISEDGASVTVRGNTWRAFPIDPPILVPDDFVVSFEYSYAEAGEFHAVCFEDNTQLGDYDDPEHNENDPKRCIMLNQFEALSNKVYVEEYQPGGPRETHRYVVNLSKVLNRFDELRYLVLILDSDARFKLGGEMTLSNFNITTHLTSCLRDVSFKFTVDDCTIKNFLAGVQAEMTLQAKKMTENSCGGDPLIELMALYDADTEMDAYRKIEQVCTSSYAPHEYDFAKTISSDAQVVQEFIDGGTKLNYERDSDKKGVSLLRDGAGIKAVAEYASRRLLTWPEHHALDRCHVGAAMCCWVDTRIDGGELADNTDVCYVDMKASRSTAHVADGWSVYGEAIKEPVNCHGFAWGNETGSTADALKGNALFNVGFWDGLYQKKNVKPVPGAPMCGCMDRMPVVTKAACTKVTTNSTSTVSISYDQETGLFKGVSDFGEIKYEDCENDLAEHYKALVGLGSYLADYMDTRLVGDGGCNVAIRNFLDKKGIHMMA